MIKERMLVVGQGANVRITSFICDFCNNPVFESYKGERKLTQKQRETKHFCTISCRHEYCEHIIMER